MKRKTAGKRKSIFWKRKHLEEEGFYEEEIFCRCSSCGDDFNRRNGDDLFCGLVAAEWKMVVLQ